MIRQDFHVHTCFSDGKETPEAMVQAALRKGMAALGFSDHSYTSFDRGYCMEPEDLPRYRETIRTLQAQYAGKLRIFLGIEQDMYSDIPAEGYDYVIGSCHYVQTGEGFVSVDDTPELFENGCRDCFDGDYLAFAEAYYAAVSEVVERTGADIIGHFDLFAKFNRKGHYFDETDPRYAGAWQQAADRLLQTGRPFEINTRALYGGYRHCPYPAPEILCYLKDRGGRFLLSSDSHGADTLCREFERFENFAEPIFPKPGLR